MAELFLTNTLTRRKERFVPADPARVTLYVCGPTVYDVAHIGNARPAVAFDVLFRLLRLLYGRDAVVYARNLTDIDDKIIAAARAAGAPIAAVTERFTALYRADMAALGVLSPTFEPAATAHIPAMTALISRLLDQGVAYRGESGVWFSVAADPDYGKLSGRAQEDLLAGARVEGEADKRAPGDFALWKAEKPGEAGLAGAAWDSPFGRGRPGWHIECSAMIEAVLGQTIDIHGGGLDLIFPHHENEIAQSETASGGAPLARYWLHNGFLTMDQEKMSKSVGNIRTPNALLAQGWAGEVLRAALLSAQYRAPLDWTEDLLKQTKAGLDRLYGALERAGDVEAAPAAPAPALVEALCDDLNTPRAFAELFSLAGALNKAEGGPARAAAKGALLASGGLMGLLQGDPALWFKAPAATEGGPTDAEIEALLAARLAARQARNYPEADRIRAELDAHGIVVMDNPGGQTWRRS